MLPVITGSLFNLNSPKIERTPVTAMNFAKGVARLVHLRPCPVRHIHGTPSTSYPRAATKYAKGLKPPPIFAETGVFLDEDDMENSIPVEERDGHGSSSLGHLLLRQQRRMLQYMRLIEHDMPKLVRECVVRFPCSTLFTFVFKDWREEFQAPSSDKPLVVRTIDYGGEEHPATSKRTVVVPVAHLPLNGPKARHALKLLAGPRWSPSPPSDSGIGPDEALLEDGFIKISCEDFPQPGMNLKWISDVLDRLIAEANVSAELSNLILRRHSNCFAQIR